MNKEYKIKLDLNKKLYNKKMAFNQFDENVNDFYIEVTKNNEVVKDLDKSIITLVAIKPNNAVDAQFIEVKEGQIYADLKPSMCDIVGNYQAKAMIVLEGEIVTTDTINYSVNEDKIISKLNEDVVSDERFPLFTDALSRLSTIEISEEQRMINEAERILSEENRKIEEAKRVEAELIRQHEEADRAKYDATRESNENIRKQNESIRLVNETNRIDEESKRVEEENKRKLAEEERKANYDFMTEDEERRRSEANAHKEAEVLRVQSETNRVNEEAKRRTTEQARVSAENTRVSNENTRKSNEETRQSNETKRVQAETQRQNRYNSFISDAEANANNFENYTNSAKVKEDERKSNELDRQTQEDRRVSNEVERISNENTRKVSENARAEAEKQRVDAENLRKEKIIEIQTDYDSLKKVIIDENASANLQNQINQTNSQLDHINKYQKIKVFNTYEDMKTDTSLKNGDICKTLGYYEINDYGGAEYYINNSTSNIINKEISNGLKAQLIIDNTKGILLDTVGIRPGSVDYIEKNSEIFNELARFASKKYQLYLNPLRYYISNLDMSDVTNFELALIGTNQNVSQNGVKSTIATNGGNFITTQKTSFFVKASDIVFTSGVTDKIPRGICFGSLQANNQEVNFDFDNVWFSLFDKAFYSPSWSCSSKGVNVTIYNCHTGIYIHNASHTLEIDTLNLNYNVCGIHLGHGGNYSELRNVHVATGYNMADADEFDEIVAIRSGGGSIIRGLYYEPYISDNTEKQILIDYTGYGWGVKGLYIYNVGISYPGAGNTGIFLRGKTNRGDHQYKWFYPDGCVHFVDCTYNINTLPNLFKIYQNSTGELTNSWFGYSINNRPIIANGIGIGRNLTYYINTTCDNLTFAKTLQNTYRLSNEFQDIDMGNGFKNTYILDRSIYQLSVYNKPTSGTIRIKGVVCLNNITSQEGVLRIMSTNNANTQTYGPYLKIVDLNTVKSEYTDSRIVIPFNFELNNETFKFGTVYANACWFECSKEITEENKSKIHLKFTVEYDQDYDNHIN